VPLIQIDLQPLTDDQRAELRTRAVAAVADAIGAPDAYVSVIIREAEPACLVEAGGWGPYERRVPIEVPRAGGG
jgi:phenylpyruvate tautomerase PptA (4-oxalocrotonate tautomerase family)